MKGNPADWQQALSAVHGIIIRGEERITTQELLAEHLGVPATDRAARRLRRVMRRLGWRPRKLRFGSVTRNGHCRKPGMPPMIGQPLGSVPTIRQGAVVEQRPTENMA